MGELIAVARERVHLRGLLDILHVAIVVHKRVRGNQVNCGIQAAHHFLERDFWLVWCDSLLRDARHTHR
jgi:hypothetical protein